MGKDIGNQQNLSAEVGIGVTVGVLAVVLLTLFTAVAAAVVFRHIKKNLHNMELCTVAHTNGHATMERCDSEGKTKIDFTKVMVIFCRITDVRKEYAVNATEL